VTLDVAARQTNTFRTNLVSIDYLRAVVAARQSLATANYDRAWLEASNALLAKPNDPDAFAVQNEAKGRKSVRAAEEFGKRGDYRSGIKELGSALEALPANEEAKQLLVDFKNREPEQIERERQERLARPKKVYDALVAKTPYAELFEGHELKTTKPIRDLDVAIVSAFQTVKPVVRVTHDEEAAPGTIAIVAEQGLTTALGTSAGGRKCLIVLGETKVDETQILLRVLEFKAEAVEKFSIGALIGAPANVNYVPVHAPPGGELSEKLQTQLKQGVKIVTDCIQSALGAIPGP